MNKYPMTVGRAEAARIMAAELLNEANARGDQDWETVSWAVGYLMTRANQEGRDTLAARFAKDPA